MSNKTFSEGSSGGWALEKVRAQSCTLHPCKKTSLMTHHSCIPLPWHTWKHGVGQAARQELCWLQSALPTCRHHPPGHSQESPGTHHCQWPTAVQLRSTSQSGPWWSLWEQHREVWEHQGATRMAGAAGAHPDSPYQVRKHSYPAAGQLATDNLQATPSLGKHLAG